MVFQHREELAQVNMYKGLILEKDSFWGNFEVNAWTFAPLMRRLVPMAFVMVRLRTHGSSS
jgi:hypothetical protein